MATTPSDSGESVELARPVARTTPRLPKHPFRPVLDTDDPYDSCEDCLLFRGEHR